MDRTPLSLVALAFLIAVQPRAAAAQPQASPRAAAKPPVTAVVNLNTAAAAQLEALLGIGAKTAARSVEYRQKHGPFKKIDDLKNDRGGGEKHFPERQTLF